MAKIIKITETATDRTFQVCLADECPAEPAPAHLETYHRSWRWGLDTEMTEEQMIAEVKLLAAEEKAKLTPEATTRDVSISI